MKVYGKILDRKRSVIEIKSKVEYDDLVMQKSASTIEKNNVFTVYKGKKTFDILPYCDSVNWVYSEKVKNLFEENEVIGIVFYPIVIEGIDEKYFGYYITGKAGKITNLDSMGLPEILPIEFNIEEWDGSDVFCFENSGMDMITERVKNLLIYNKITNLIIEEQN